jgi:hypothetical protein
MGAEESRPRKKTGSRKTDAKKTQKRAEQLMEKYRAAAERDANQLAKLAERLKTRLADKAKGDLPPKTIAETEQTLDKAKKRQEVHMATIQFVNQLKEHQCYDKIVATLEGCLWV